jgi:hypothetical protein
MSYTSWKEVKEKEGTKNVVYYNKKTEPKLQIIALPNS